MIFVLGAFLRIQYQDYWLFWLMETLGCFLEEKNDDQTPEPLLIYFHDSSWRVSELENCSLHAAQKSFVDLEEMNSESR